MEMMEQSIFSIYLTGVLLIASVLFWIMRFWMSKTESELSSSDEDSESEAEEISDINRSLDTDAVNPDGGRGRHPVTLTISELRKIEQSLEDYEKISLIFLLSDDSRDCLKKIELSEWAMKQEKARSNTWQVKLWEALAIIKNFQIPKKYGFSKEHLIEEYFPFQYFTTKHVSKYKKILFFICENLTKANEKIFLQQLRKDFERRSLRFEEFPEMEMYFSYLLEISYISPKSTQNCSRIAKTLHMEDAYDLFKYIEEDNTRSADEREVRKPRVNRLYSNISADKEVNNDSCFSAANSDSTQDNVPVGKSLDGIYNMDGKKLCLIIDQEIFYTEVDPEYEHLLPANNAEEKLHSRLGTKEDSKRLESVFKKRDFEVKIVCNLTHLKIIEELKKFVASIDRRTCSSFFVIILSHGNKDVVYGSNSCYVEISQIISIMDSKRCIRVPKILILQACQGPTLLKHIDESLTTDGPTAVEGSDLKCPDFLLFSSTVPGFASIRDKRKGTWFIQSLCEKLEIYADKEHFQDICTKVTDHVGNSKWRHYQMIPYLRTTMFKKLYI